jgi:ubiquinone/menaquinone biosynthesis C-methylase UbiE
MRYFMAPNQQIE